MYLKYLLSFITFSLFLTSCIDDEVPNSTLDFADVELKMRGKFDGAPFVQNRVYALDDGSRIRFSEFNFFVAELTTTVDVDESFSLDDVEYIDLALFQGEEAALEGFTVNIGRAPVDEYRGFSFGIGINPELNQTTPDEYGQNHPMGQEDRYDADLEGYQFLTISGEIDYNSDGTYDNSFKYVLGFDQNYKVITSTKSLDILPDVTNVIEVDVDLKQILDNGIRSVNFMEQLNTTANPSDEIMLLLNSNIAGAISVK